MDKSEDTVIVSSDFLSNFNINFQEVNTMRIKEIKKKSVEEIREDIKNGILYINGTDVLDNDVTIEIPITHITNLENIVSEAVAALAENKEENK